MLSPGLLQSEYRVGSYRMRDFLFFFIPLVFFLSPSCVMPSHNNLCLVLQFPAWDTLGIFFLSCSSSIVKFARLVSSDVMLLRSTRDESGGRFICGDNVDNGCFFEKMVCEPSQRPLCVVGNSRPK